MNLEELYSNGYIQIENKWFSLYNEENLIKQLGTESFYLLVNLLQYRTYNNFVCFNKQFISNLFGNTRFKNSTTAYKALKKLVDNDILIINQEINYNKPKVEDLIIAEINLPITFNNNYFILANNQLNKILEYNGKENKHKLLSLFCAIRHRIYDNQAAKISLKTLNNELGISEKTILKYINILQDLNLIVYDNPGTRKLSNNTFRESPNFYTLALDGAEDILRVNIEEYKKQQIAKGIKFV